MKELIKKVFPARIIRMLRSARPESNGRKSPLVTQYLGSAESVLGCCISYIEYGGYCVPLSSCHRPAAQKILSGEVWEPETISYLTKHCGTGDIVHAGTYFGDFLPALSRACAADAKVWAFEPNPENSRCARVTALINDLRNVEVMQAGLGSQRGTLTMMVADGSGRSLGGGSQIIELSENDHVKDQVANVTIVKLDDVIMPDRNIAIIQLDVEGFEQPALSGAGETIRRCKPILVLENLPEERWLSENIMQLGYRVLRKVHANTILAPSWLP